MMEEPEAGMIVNEKFVLRFALKSSHIVLKNNFHGSRQMRKAVWLRRTEVENKIRNALTLYLF